MVWDMTYFVHIKGVIYVMPLSCAELALEIVNHLDISEHLISGKSAKISYFGHNDEYLPKLVCATIPEKSLRVWTG